MPSLEGHNANELLQEFEEQLAKPTIPVDGKGVPTFIPLGAEKDASNILTEINRGYVPDPSNQVETFTVLHQQPFYD